MGAHWSNCSEVDTPCDLGEFNYQKGSWIPAGALGYFIPEPYHSKLSNDSSDACLLFAGTPAICHEPPFLRCCDSLLALKGIVANPGEILVAYCSGY